MTNSALAGCRVVVTRASHQAAPLVEALQAAGATVVAAPAIAIVPPTNGGQPLDDALLRLERFSWAAFTSTNAIAVTLARCHRRGIRDPFANVKVAAVGVATAARVAQEIGRPPDLLPDRPSKPAPDEPDSATPTAADLAAAFPDPSPTDHCFLPMAQEGRPDLADNLWKRGWQVTAVAAYRTIHPHLPHHLLGQVTTADVVVFASPSAVKGHLTQLAKHGRTFDSNTTAAVCIGPTTAAACQESGIQPAAISQGADTASLLAAVTTTHQTN